MTPTPIKSYASGPPGYVKPRSLNEIIEQLNALIIDVNGLKQGAGDVPRLITTYLFVPSANAHCGGVYTGKLYELTPGDFDADELDTYTVAEHIGTAGRDAVGINLREEGTDRHGVPLDASYTAMLRSVGSDGKPIVLFDDTPAKLFPVTVSQVGGSAGDATTACTYTYDVTPLAGGGTIGTAKAVVWARPVGLMTAGTHGVAYFDSASSLVLYQVDEVPQTDTECP